MANPRKFSEKIALHNQKQAEDTARFEQIMREVSDATKAVTAHPKQHLRINPTLGSFRGGSLPNVNHVANNAVQNKTDLPNAQSNFEDLNNSRSDVAVAVTRERGRQPGVGPMRGRAIEKRIDTSPYGGAIVGATGLLLPPDTGWRRTNSDSALHHSAMCGQDIGGPRRSHHDTQMLALSLGDRGDQRPRSSCYDGSLVPGISICPSPLEPGEMAIPIGNNTGSLPDLTSFQSFHFSSPLSMPLDQEDHTSSFSTSPQATSPSTLSPTCLPSQSRPMGRFPFGGCSPQESRVPSPHSTVHSQVQAHSPGQRRRCYPQTHLQGLVIGPHSPVGPHGGPHSPTQQSPLQNHLFVPSLISNSSYLHQSKGVTHDHSGNVTLDGFGQKFVYHSAAVSPPLTNCSLSPQPEGAAVSHQPQLTSLNSYRSPQPNRPSPQNSPGLTVQQYRSASPGEHSSPQSPASPAASGTNTFSDATYYLNETQAAAALQRHFEQFNMVDTPAASITYITAPPNSVSTTQVMSPEESVGQELNAEYYSTSPSQLHFNKPMGGSSTQQTTPQTPNTPSSIPDIILTDADELTKHELAKDIGSAMTGSFDSDLFPVDDIRESLGPIDFDGFQMLTDPDMTVTDPLTESNFRYDRLDSL